MDSNTEFKKIDIRIRTCYYFDDIIKIERLCNICIISLDEVSHPAIQTKGTWSIIFTISSHKT